MSVAKLCEALEGVRSKPAHRTLKEQRTKIEESFDYAQDDISREERKVIPKASLWEKTKDQETNNGKQTTITEQAKLNIEVFTTTANGKSELDVTPNQQVIVDGVSVTYFKRLTKDHTHFSPALLWSLRKEILSNIKNPPPTPPINRSKLSRGGHDLVVHIHAWWNLVSILSCFIAKWYNIPIVLSPRGMLTTYTQTNNNSLIKKIIHYTIGESLLSYCHIHATSEQEKREILSFTKPKSITVIPNLVELGEDKRIEIKNQRVKKNEQSTTQKKSIGTNTQEKSKFKLIFLSRVEQKKGLELLFSALAELTIDWCLTIGGTGEEAYVMSLKKEAERLKINSRINWVGQIKHQDKFQLLAEHDLMVLTSYNENFANVVVESLSVGTPVLISDQVGLADYVVQNNFGWITSLQPENITENILQSYKDSIKRALIRENAAEKIKADFSDHLADRYFELYRSLI